MDSNEYLFFYNTKIQYDQEMSNIKKTNTFVPKPSYIKCLKCESNLVTIESKQVRSFDEGETCFNFCHNCNFKWKN